MFTFIQISGHSWSTRPSCLHGVKHLCIPREKHFLPERLKDFSLTSFTRRTIPRDVCENFRGFRASRCSEDNVCALRSTLLFFHEDDDIVHFRGCYNPYFSLSRLSFLSSVVTMSTSKPIGVCLVNRWKKGSAERSRELLL